MYMITYIYVLIIIMIIIIVMILFLLLEGGGGCWDPPELGGPTRFSTRREGREGGESMCVCVYVYIYIYEIPMLLDSIYIYIYIYIYIERDYVPYFTIVLYIVLHKTARL